MNYLILAAGIGSRLNYQKYYLKINGYTLLEHAYNKISSPDSNDIFVVYKDESVRKNHAHLNVNWLKNECESLDKEISISLGLETICEKCIILLADMPCYNKKCLDFLERDKTTFSFDGETIMPPLYLSKTDVENYLTSPRSLKDSIKEYQIIKLDKKALRDVDTMEDVVAVRKNIIIISGGDLASATINILIKNGFNVHIIELDKPLAVRRSVAYSEAMFEDEKIISDVKAVKVNNYEEYLNAKFNGYASISNKNVFNDLGIKIDCLVDITLRKRRLLYLSDDYLCIGVGPAFVAGEDVDYVIESQRGKDLGKVIKEGSALENTGVPQKVCDYTMERVLYSKNEGIFISKYEIGDEIVAGAIFGYVNQTPVYAQIDGVIRGMIRNGVYVNTKVKIGDINPQMNDVDINKFSDKSLSIGNAILELCKEL